MFRQKLFKPIALVLILVSLTAALYLDVYRLGSEQANRQVDILLDYDEVNLLAKANNVPLAALLREFAEKGVTGVLIRERTVRDLEQDGRIAVSTVAEFKLLQTANPGFLPGFEPQEGYSYLIFDNANAEEYQYVLEHLQIKKKNVQGKKFGELSLIALPLSAKETEKLGLGFPPLEMQAVAASGLSCVPRLRDWGELDKAGLELLQKTLAQIPNLSLVTFNDETITAANNLPALAGILQELKVPTATFEFFNQEGLGKLAYLTDKNVVRAHAISENEMMKLTQAEALRRYKLAASERNIRVLYVRLFGLTTPDKALERALSFIEDIRDGVASEGYQAGTAITFNSLPYSRVLIILLGLGVLAAGLILLSRFLPQGWVLLLGIAGLIGWAGLCFVAPTLARKGAALLAVIIFPLLGVLSVLQEEKRTLPQAVLQLLKMSLLSLCGAAIMTGLLADKAFMLKLDGFSGVKLAHVAPVVFIFLVLFLRQERPWQKFKELWGTPVTFLYAGLGLFVLAVLAIYVVRTGNDGTALVSSLEVKFREALDNLMDVRPRTKEFLLGHPFMLAVLYFGFDWRKSILLLFGMIGQISLVNTYAHIHTPLLISLTRSFHGLWLGIVLGLILIWVLKIYYKYSAGGKNNE